MKTHLEVQQREDIRPYLLFWMWFETAVRRRTPQWLTTTLPVLDCLWLEKVKAHRWRRWETTPFSMATLSLKGGPASFHLLTIHTKLWQTRWWKGPHSRQPRSLHWNKLKETDQPTQPRGTCHSLPSPSLLGQGHRDASTSIERQQLKLFAKATHVVVVVEWLYYSKRRIIVRWADLSDFFVDFRRKMCIFVSRPMNIVTFVWKTVRPQNGLLIFLGKETHSETTSWKSSRILSKKVTTTTVNFGNRRGFCVWIQFFSFSFFFHHFSSFFLFFFIFSFFHFYLFSFFHFFLFYHFFIYLIFSFFHFLHFLSFFHFSFIFFHFLSFSFIFVHFLSCSFMFFHVLSCSFMFFHVLSCSFMFFHVLSCSFMFFHVSFMFFHFLCLCWGAQNLTFFGPQISLRFLLTVLMWRINFWAHLGWYSLWALFSFFSYFFSPVFCLSSCFLFFIFSLFLFSSSFFDFFNVFRFLFSFFPKKKFLLFFFLVFLSNIFYNWR